MPLRRALVAGAACYAGEGAPPLAFAASCVAALVEAGEAPRGFALDVGVRADGEPLVVECNDGLALGLYAGVSFETYTDVICARWAELMEDLS